MIKINILSVGEVIKKQNVDLMQVSLRGYQISNAGQEAKRKQTIKNKRKNSLKKQANKCVCPMKKGTGEHTLLLF